METYNPADHMVMCRKYKQNLPKMPKPPFPNKLGEEIAKYRVCQSMERMARAPNHAHQ
jgi:Fe-S cluster biosynthesis and repair protein YggX